MKQTCIYLVSLLRKANDKIESLEYSVREATRSLDHYKQKSAGCLREMPSDKDPTGVFCDRAASHKGQHFNVIANVAWIYAGEEKASPVVYSPR